MLDYCATATATATAEIQWLGMMKLARTESRVMCNVNITTNVVKLSLPALRTQRNEDCACTKHVKEEGGWSYQQ